MEELPRVDHVRSERSVTGFLYPSSSASTSTEAVAVATAAGAPAAVAPPDDFINTGRGYCGQNPISFPNLHHQSSHLQITYPSNSSTFPHFSLHKRGGASTAEDDAIKARIMAHPQYAKILAAYIDCQKVGAPPDIADQLSATALDQFNSRQQAAERSSCPHLPEDPELDQFMEVYQQLLVRYQEELTKPLQEARNFLKGMEAQLNALTNVSVNQAADEIFTYGGCSSEENQEGGSGEEENDKLPAIDPRAEERELKVHLLKRYSGCLSNLRQELTKKRKKGKLPKEARQKLLLWWEQHYKWPYPSESEKMALAESTGLDQKQINNWFINQRKRHWKPSDQDMMHFAVIEGYPNQPPSTATALYMNGHEFMMGNGLYHHHAQ